MAILVVGGSAKDIGKTALVCAIISALREFDWTAVKISGHDYDAEDSTQMLEARIWEETRAGNETDTSRYLAAGARRALLVTRWGAEVPVDVVRRAVGADRNVIYESNRIADAVAPDVCVALVAGSKAEWKSSFTRFVEKADALVYFEPVEVDAAVRSGIVRFELKSADALSPEMVKWLRERMRV